MVVGGGVWFLRGKQFEKGEGKKEKIALKTG